MQVVDRQKFARNGRYLVRIWVWDALYSGSPGTQTFSLVTGTMQNELMPDHAIDVVTDEYGKIELDVTIAGAASRYAHAVVIAEISVSSVATWA